MTQLAPSFLKSLFLLHSFLFHPFLRYFRQFHPTPPPPHPHRTPFCHNLTHQLSSHIINRFKEISKELSYQFSCRFLSKIKNQFLIFYILLQIYNLQIYSLQIYIVYLNLWDIFRFIFRQLKDDFFYKVMVTEKITFLQMPNTILQRIISKCKNDKP